MTDLLKFCLFLAVVDGILEFPSESGFLDCYGGWGFALGIEDATRIVDDCL